MDISNIAGKTCHFIKKIMQITPANTNVTRIIIPNTLNADYFDPSPLMKINNLLQSVYGIHSEIKDLRIAQKVLETVKNFCVVNQSKKLFNGLSLTSSNNFAEKTEISLRKWDYNKKTFNIDFNEIFNWNNLEEITQENYDCCKLPSNNPLCTLYKELGYFLNFKYNPAVYKVLDETRTTLTSEKLVKRIGDSTYVNDFNANYVAGRMCGIPYPKIICDTFLQDGNNDLIFPKPIPLIFKQGSIHNFKSVEEGTRYLRRKYGIYSEFMNAEQANRMSEAADDLVKAADNNDIFKGLKIIIKLKNSTDVRMTFVHENIEQPKIIINEAFHWKRDKQIAIDNYQNGYHPTPRQKDAFIHELSHYLDFKGNPERFEELSDLSFTDQDLNIASKVSEYAGKNIAEFCTEYVAGRMAGIKYPKYVTKEFIANWNGPKLNFDLL